MILLNFLCGEANSRKEGPTIHHFRFSDLKDEENYLMTKRKECSKEEIIFQT